MPAWRGRSWCCKAMDDAGFIDQNTRAMAQATRPRIVRANGTPGSGWFADWVVAHLNEVVAPSPSR